MNHLRASIAIVLVGSLAGAEPPKTDFAHDVLPVLKKHCAKCHSDGTYKGGFNMDNRPALLRSKGVAPGKKELSELYQRITEKDPKKRMPPKLPPLADKEIAALGKWIDEGVTWQEGFSFTKASYVPRLEPRLPELPPAQAGRTNPIDRIVDAYFAKHKVQRPAPLEDALFLRRLHLDVIGLLPTPEQLEAFLADKGPDKRQRAIDAVLKDNRAYAEHWLTFWNDLLRNDYAGTGYIDGGRKQITDWLYRSLYENKPYDQFVRELIDPKPEAEGFINGIKWRGNVNASQVREIQFAQNITQVFLGINLKCASCHDSFIDHWKLEDAYGLAAVIAGRPLEIHRCDKPTGQMAEVSFLYPQLGTIDPKLDAKKRLGQLAVILTKKENGRLTRTIVNRLWQRLMGRGIVHPVDVMSNEPFSEDLLDYLGAHLADNGYDLKKTLELIVSSQTYQSQAVAQAKEDEGADFVFRGPLPRRMTAEQFIDALWQVTGTTSGKSAVKVERGSAMLRSSLVVADPLLLSLGRPHRDQVVTTRPEQLTTLQALDLSNGQQLADTLTRGASALRKAHPKWGAVEMTDFIYRSALCRLPTADERKLAVRIAGEPLSEAGLADLLWVIFMLPEFQIVR
ncbi:MAG: PSD1 and planctomycete cytochrome C domain-containing protein [Gemmataceae bacterium]